MSGVEIPIGGVGCAVAARIAERRRHWGMSYVGLSRRLEAGGRSIAPAGLRRIELGVRRVDVDDVFALAVALDTSVSALLGLDGARREVVASRVIASALREVL